MRVWVFLRMVSTNSFNFCWRIAMGFGMIRALRLACWGGSTFSSSGRYLYNGNWELKRVQWYQITLMTHHSKTALSCLGVFFRVLLKISSVSMWISGRTSFMMSSTVASTFFAIHLSRFSLALSTHFGCFQRLNRRLPSLSNSS